MTALLRSLVLLILGMTAQAAATATLPATPWRAAPGQALLLGEVHDNAAQHALRAQALAALLALGDRPALLLEPFDREHQPAIDAVLQAAAPTDAAALEARIDALIDAGGRAAGWNWALYRPYLRLALQHGLPVVAANVSRAEARRIVQLGLAATGWQPEVPADIARAQAAAIEASHCGQVDAAFAARLAGAQIARDQFMARMIETHAARGAVLLAGNGHVRSDIGVPRWLSPAQRERSQVVGFLESGDEDTAGYDAVRRTAAQPREDPCAALRRSPMPAAPGVTAAPAQALHALFDAAWDSEMRRYPEWATHVGDKRYGDRLQDASDEAEAQAYAETRQRLAQALAIDAGALGTKDRVSLALFVHRLRETLAFEPLVGYRRLSLGAIGGFHTGLAGLLRASPVDTPADAEQVLTRLAAYPRRVDQELQHLRQGLALGWVAPRPVIARVLATLDKQLADRGEASPFFEPFARLGREITAAEQAALRARARQAIAAQVLPAQQRLRDFIAGDYAAAAPAAGNLGSYPGGAAVYAALVRRHTTTELSPAQIHAIGLREAARLRGEIDQVMRDMAWTGDFDGFVRHLNTDPKHFHTSPQALLAAYRDIGKRIDAALPKLFAELPRAPWGVRAMPAEMGPDAAENYSGPALDGSRPGWFNANAEAWRTKPRWGQETLVAHEAVPGHHLQSARAAELGELPKFRRSGGYVAYGEGWALYAETLGFELGLYQDPASRFGHLQWQMLRAARLVVDTGLHHLGWSRQQAIDYLGAQTGENPALVASEVDRYTSWPGQALGYMIGQLKIIELRDRARAALGARFDIRRFHMAVLDQGAVPLDMLDRQIDDWTAAEAARR